MSSTSWLLDAPVGQPNITNILVGGISIDTATLVANLPIQNATGPQLANAVPNTAIQYPVQLTAGDLTTIIDLIVARANANGQAVPAGHVEIA